VCLVAAAAVLVRLPGIDRPLVGPFATKNVVYGMIARNWAEGRASWREPTLDVLTPGGQALHLLEVPLAAYGAGWLWHTAGGSLDVWGRVASIAASAGAAVFLFLLVRRWHGTGAATAAALFWCVAPVNIVYGRAFMLEPSAIFFLLGLLWAADTWGQTRRARYLALAGLLLFALTLTKSYLLLFVPVAVDVARRRFWVAASPKASRWSGARHVAALALTMVLMLVVGQWLVGAYRARQPGSPVADRVFYSIGDSASVHRPPHPLLGKSEFYRRMADDLAGCVLTPVGVVLALVGGLGSAARRHWLWLALAAGLVLLMPLKFYEMNYYWLIVLPPLCILVGLGWQQLTVGSELRRSIQIGLVAVLLLFSVRYSVGPIFHRHPEDEGVVAAGAAVRKLTQAGDRVATSHGTTLDLLYYADRRGWIIDSEAADAMKTLAECRRQGAKLLAVAGEKAALDGWQHRIGRPPLEKGRGFAIYSLAD